MNCSFPGFVTNNHLRISIGDPLESQSNEITIRMANMIPSLTIDINILAIQKIFQTHQVPDEIEEITKRLRKDKNK